MELKIPPPLLALILAVSMWAIARGNNFELIDTALKNSLTLIVFLIGLTIDILAIISFRTASTTVNPMRPKNTTQLVVVGIYKFSRNPMYLGLTLLLSAWAIWLGSPHNLILLVFLVWYLTQFQIKPEEKILEELFPEEFSAYKSRVRRWI